MLALLEQAEEMNRTDQPFQSDSIGKALVSYYDNSQRTQIQVETAGLTQEGEFLYNK